MLFVTLGIAVIDGAGECGTSSPDKEATKLVPCAAAAQYHKAGACLATCFGNSFLFPKQQNRFQHIAYRLATCFETENR
jgi:hypothetical protein